MDERGNYGYGYAPVGERFYALKSGRQQGRVNMIAGDRDGQLIAPFTIEGACNRTVFEVWLQTCLIPHLRPGHRGLKPGLCCTSQRFAAAFLQSCLSCPS